MIKKIVLTGGPGSGKTTVIESIKKNFGGKYKVIVVDETASYLINMGLRPFGDNHIDMVDFQELVLKTQLSKEEMVDRAVEVLPEDNIIIIYDRGLLDNCAYINAEEFQEVLSRLDKKHTINEFLERYDLIINLVSRKDFYTTDNNPARSEAVDEALKLGSKTLAAWVGHNNIKIVSPKDDIDEKIKEVLNHINELLQEKQVKRQAKYLIDLDTLNKEYLESISKRANITQDYLESSDSIEKRLRKTEMSGVTTYSYTVFKTLEDGRKIKVSDESISEKLYEKLLEFKDENKETITKQRYYFPYEDEYFTLDIIGDIGVLEINISEGEKVTIPSFIDAMEDVTDNPIYRNKNIATKNNKQLVK